ncbi:MAG: S8 family peptidase [Chloroflexi bacterium]|nr:S8 family peptidase [Chloroflexota bacterium]
MKPTLRFTINWGKRRGLVRSALLLVALLCLATTGATGIPLISAPTNATAVPVNVQPILTKYASENPDSLVSVIVQKTGADTRAEELVTRLGGRVTTDLSIINGFAAELQAKDVARLAHVEGVRQISLDAVMTSTTCTQCIDTATLANAYIRAIGADKVWNKSPYLQGQGIGVAVVDSGINPNGDLYTVLGKNRQIANVRFNTDYNQNTSDGYGHGTHVSSIVGGDGSESGGKYIGVAPMVNIINVKVSNDNGSAMTKNVVQGLQWVLANKAKYNIRVVNLSLNSSVAESYHTSPLAAAVEILWFNKIVVVASAGNQGKGAIYPPANDPFVITVGATDDKGTNSISDDVVTSFSAYGTTGDGVVKPDLVAPGANIVARLVNSNMGLAKAHPANKVANGVYFRMSGTSMSAPIVSGAIALLLQDEPNLTPDQVKYRLKATANNKWAGYNATKAGAGYLDIDAAVNGTSTQSANSGITISRFLFTGTNKTWGSANWDSANWDSANWDSANWDSASWDSANWDSDYWGP